MNEFRKKLGPELVKEFRVFNHNIYENCVEIGATGRGTKMMINREVAGADIRVAIGAVTAHPQVGFCGGGKIILPGIAHVDSISHYHLEVAPMAPETTGLGNFDHNILRADIADAVELAGLEFMVNVIVNGRGATTDIFAGDFVEAHNEAVKLAKDHYATDPKAAGKDLVISNAFVKANEMTIAARLGMAALKNSSGTVVVIAKSPEGQVVHYLLGRYGCNYGGANIQSPPFLIR